MESVIAALTFANVSNIRVENNEFIRVSRGITVSLFSVNITITNNSISGGTDEYKNQGITIVDSSYITVTNNEVNHFNVGMYLRDTSNLIITDNNLCDNQVPIEKGGGDSRNYDNIIRDNKCGTSTTTIIIISIVSIFSVISAFAIIKMILKHRKMKNFDNSEFEFDFDRNT